METSKGQTPIVINMGQLVLGLTCLSFSAYTISLVSGVLHAVPKPAFSMKNKARQPTNTKLMVSSVLLCCTVKPGNCGHSQRQT